MTDAPAPPHDLDAEESLLGAIMLSRDATRAATAAGITAADFYRPAHATIYTACLRVQAAGAHCDPTTVAAALDTQLEHVGGRPALAAIQAATPASANAVHYATIVRELARRRELMAIADEIGQAARAGTDPSIAVARLTTVAAPDDSRRRLIAGDVFTIDRPDSPPAIWGHDDRILWAQGEELMLVGPPGVGKTTVSAQLVAARLGILTGLLELPVVQAARTLYLACDRPSQISRAFARLMGAEHRALLAERLVIWRGPPPRDFATHPDTLLALARDANADCVFVDSLKDVAIGLSDDTVGAALNNAIQRCLAEGIDVCVLHHQRKGQAGAKPRTLEDVYGSTWLTAGAGSIILLWGQAGDPIVELVHLKQPSAEVGPVQIDHDHNTGRTLVFRGDIDPLRVLRQATNGLSATDLASLRHGRDKPTDVQRRKAKRTLDALVAKGLAHRRAGDRAGEADRYFATVAELDLVAAEAADELEEVF